MCTRGVLSPPGRAGRPGGGMWHAEHHVMFARYCMLCIHVYHIVPHSVHAAYCTVPHYVVGLGAPRCQRSINARRNLLAAWQGLFPDLDGWLADRPVSGSDGALVDRPVSGSGWLAGGQACFRI